MPCPTPAAHAPLSLTLLTHAHGNLQALVPLYPPGVLNDLINASIGIAKASEQGHCLVCETESTQDVVFLTGLLMRGVEDEEVMKVALGPGGEKREAKMKVVGELRSLWGEYMIRRGGGRG